ncbi:single-stranded-DNA-specific exonuclease [Alphaproteobacteria bacterium]
MSVLQGAASDHTDFGRSVRNYNWVLLTPEERIVLSLSQKLSVHRIVATILANRDITCPEYAKSFLFPKLRELLPDPFQLQDMDKAVDRLFRAIEKKEKITVFADYDVDGATAAALLHHFFQALNVQVEIYIPHRVNEGYGPNVEAMKKIKKSGNKVVITVDCGTTALEPLKIAREIGLDVVVLDHHVVGEVLPEAVAVVNPNRIDDTFPEKALAAVGVVFFFVVAFRKTLRKNGWFIKNHITEPNLINFLDLVALGTVCDVIPLTPLNRIFVMHGLKLISQRQNMGLAALIEILKIDVPISVYHLGYVIGPRINASGRIAESNLGVKLLTTNDYVEAKSIALKLDRLNEERKVIEMLAVEEAMTQIEKTRKHLLPVIIAIGEDWHTGILGILASRVKERYGKPSIAISIGKDDVCKGSGRSIAGVDLGKAIAGAKQLNLLSAGGGHAVACGFTLYKNNIDAFCKYIVNEPSIMHNSIEALSKARELAIDVVLKACAINYELFKNINYASPFGYGNSSPRFALLNVKIIRATIVRNMHISAIVTDVGSNMHNTAYQNKFLKCVLFRGCENELGRFLLNNEGKVVNIAGTMRNSNVNAEKVELAIDDIATYET